MCARGLVVLYWQDASGRGGGMRAQGGGARTGWSASEGFVAVSLPPRLDPVVKAERERGRPRAAPQPAGGGGSREGGEPGPGVGRRARRARRPDWTCFQLPSPARHRDLLTLQNGCSRNPGTRWRARCLVAHLRRRQPAGAPSHHRHRKAGVQGPSVGLQTTWQSELDFTAGSLRFEQS